MGDEGGTAEIKMSSGPNSARAAKSPSLSLTMLDDDNDDDEEKDDEESLTLTQAKKKKAAVIRKKLQEDY